MEAAARQLPADAPPHGVQQMLCTGKRNRGSSRPGQASIARSAAAGQRPTAAAIAAALQRHRELHKKAVRCLTAGRAIRGMICVDAADDLGNGLCELQP